MFIGNKSPWRVFPTGASQENPKLLLFVHSHPVLINSRCRSILANASAAAYSSSLQLLRGSLKQFCPCGFHAYFQNKITLKKTTKKNTQYLLYNCGPWWKATLAVHFFDLRVIERKWLICGGHPGCCSAIKSNLSLFRLSCLSSTSVAPSTPALTWTWLSATCRTPRSSCWCTRWSNRWSPSPSSWKTTCASPTWLWTWCRGRTGCSTSYSWLLVGAKINSSTSPITQKTSTMVSDSPSYSHSPKDTNQCN